MSTWSRERGTFLPGVELDPVGGLLSVAQADGRQSGETASRRACNQPKYVQPMKLTFRELCTVTALLLLCAALVIASTWATWLLAFAAEGF